MLLTKYGTRDEGAATRSPRTVIDNVEFVTAWMKAKSLDDVVRAFNTEAKVVTTKAVNLRKQGVRLPKFSRGVQRTEVDKLNDIIKKLKG